MPHIILVLFSQVALHRLFLLVFFQRPATRPYTIPCPPGCTSSPKSPLTPDGSTPAPAESCPIDTTEVVSTSAQFDDTSTLSEAEFCEDEVRPIIDYDALMNQWNVSEEGPRRRRQPQLQLVIPTGRKKQLDRSIRLIIYYSTDGNIQCFY